MSYIGVWNTCRNYEGEHCHLYLREGSVTVRAFGVGAGNDDDALKEAHRISKREDHQLISLSYLSGQPPKFDSRRIYNGED